MVTTAVISQTSVQILTRCFYCRSALYFVLKVTKENEPKTEIGEAIDYSKHFFVREQSGVGA